MISEQDIKFWGKRYGSIYPYLEGSTPYNKLLDDVLNFLSIEKDDVILDCGAGSGMIIKRILETRGDIKTIDAIDISDIMLNHLKNKLNILDYKLANKVNLVKHDLSFGLPFNSERYDIVISNLVLTYIVSHRGQYGEKALEGVLFDMYRVLKTGGIFVWSTPMENVNFIKVFLASWKDILDPRYYKRLYYGPLILMHALSIQKKGRDGIYHFFSENKLQILLDRVGFKNIRFKKSFAGQAWVIFCNK